MIFTTPVWKSVKTPVPLGWIWIFHQAKINFIWRGIPSLDITKLSTLDSESVFTLSPPIFYDSTDSPETWRTFPSIDHQNFQVPNGGILTYVSCMDTAYVRETPPRK